MSKTNYLILRISIVRKLAFSVLILLTFLFSRPLDAVPLETLSLDFKRELTENNKTEEIIGTLHYDVKAVRVVVEVTKPLKQIMITKDKVLEIYYPVEKQAFRFLSQGRIPLPFVESIIQTTQAEYGLTALGYTLNKHDVVDKVLFTHWNPPKEAKDKLGAIILGMQEDKLISAEIKNPKGQIIARSTYENHHKIGNFYVPMAVTSNTYGENSKVVQQEIIVYSNPKVNEEPKDELLSFTIPDSVKVKVIKW